MTSKIIEPEPQKQMATRIHYRREYRLPGREDWATIQTLLPYLWPKKELDVKARVLAALLVWASQNLRRFWSQYFTRRQLILYQPMETSSDFINLDIDSLWNSSGSTARLCRIASSFARVGQRAIRKVALKTFRHLHALSLRFHLDRQTGGLSRN